MQGRCWNGLDWRDFRNTVTDKASWKRHQIEFVNAACEKWKIRGIRRATLETGNATGNLPSVGARDIGNPFQGPEPNHEKAGAIATDIPWSRAGGCFCFVVDCKPLSDVINGHCTLECEEVRSVIEITLQNLEEAIDAGWVPSTFCSDPVRWVKRDHNVVADALCNRAMDCKTNIQTTFEPETATRFNILVHSDGGSRPGCSSSAWIAEAVSWDEAAARWKRTTLATSATYCDTSVSSFVAEALALYHATCFFKGILRKLGSMS